MVFGKQAVFGEHRTVVIVNINTGVCKQRRVHKPHISVHSRTRKLCGRIQIVGDCLHLVDREE